MSFVSTNWLPVLKSQMLLFRQNIVSVILVWQVCLPVPVSLMQRDTSPWELSLFVNFPLMSRTFNLLKRMQDWLQAEVAWSRSCLNSTMLLCNSYRIYNRHATHYPHTKQSAQLPQNALIVSQGVKHSLLTSPDDSFLLSSLHCAKPYELF